MKLNQVKEKILPKNYKKGSFFMEKAKVYFTKEITAESLIKIYHVQNVILPMLELEIQQKTT